MSHDISSKNMFISSGHLKKGFTVRNSINFITRLRWFGSMIGEIDEEI